MTKINQIQNALKELGEGAFQKLAEYYLFKKYHQEIHSTGSVAGSNKTRKGTPDTLIRTDDGRYIFCEYTTIARHKLYNKLSEDIKKCLDEKKTRIKVSKIKEIVLCYTSALSLENTDKLQEQCAKSGMKLTLFGLGTISNDLAANYPSIARDFLDIEIDTGEIVDLDEFISRYEKNKLATTLNTKFRFRTNEKQNVLSLLQDNSVVIISGQAGVGKSRIAVKCCREFMKTNSKYKDYCIFNKKIASFKDIQAYFSDAGDFLIFVDDANRISGFQHIIQLLQTKRSNQNFKIIVTVRDYALDEITRICESTYGVAKITIGLFTNEEIEKFLKDELEIKNYEYLKRITDIAHGNARLAMMAGKVAKDSNRFDSIRDVSRLYDIYYSSIRKDLKDLEDSDILKVAGIVAFFGTVDKANENQMLAIDQIFHISAECFWKASKRLHDMEVMNMYEDEVVKISDQILATYLFYLVFFKEKLIDFSILINNFFPEYKRELIDAIYPILNTFNFSEIKTMIEPTVDTVWNEAHNRRDEKYLLQLIDVLWFLKPTKTLMYIRDKINNLQNQDIDLNDIKFESDPNGSLPEFLSTLPRFSGLGEKEIKVSLDLFLKYAKKQPEYTPIILHYLIDAYGFKSDFCCHGYYAQHAVIEKIIKHSNSGSDEYYTRMFIAVAENYLHTHFSDAKSSKEQITFIDFDQISSPSLLKLRENILKELFDLYKNKKYEQYVLELLLSYTRSRFNIAISGDVVKNDSKYLIPFLSDELNPSNIFHYTVVQAYFKLLKRLDIQVDKKLIKRFNLLDRKFYDLLTNKFARFELKLSLDAYEEYKKKQIAKLTMSYSKEDYDKLLHHIVDILKTQEGDYSWAINQGILSILEELSERDPNLLCEVVGEYLKQDDYLDINPRTIVFNMLRSCDTKKIFEIINTTECASKNRWLLSYYQHIDPNDIKPKHIEQLCELYEKSELQYFINDMDYLLKFESRQAGLIVDIVQIVMKRASTDPKFVGLISSILNPYTNVNKNLSSLFFGKFTLLEDVYVAIDNATQLTDDYDGTTFAVLLDNDLAFMDRYLEYKFSNKDYLSYYDNSRDYSFIWLRDDCFEIMQRITPIVLQYDLKMNYFGYCKSFFDKMRDPQTDNVIVEKQKKYLIQEIEAGFDSNDYMRFLFSVIVEFPLERKLIFYKAFLDKNKEPNDFKKLPYEADFCLRGSEVPMLEDTIQFYERIIQFCDSADLLKHKDFLETKIKKINRQIQHEEKRYFTEGR